MLPNSSRTAHNNRTKCSHNSDDNDIHLQSKKYNLVKQNQYDTAFDDTMFDTITEVAKKAKQKKIADQRAAKAKSKAKAVEAANRKTTEYDTHTGNTFVRIVKTDATHATMAVGRKKVRLGLKDFFFDKNDFGFDDLAPGLKKLTYADVPSLIGSMVVYNPTSLDTQAKRDQHVEFKRQLEPIRETWYTSEEKENELRRFITTFVNISNVISTPVEVVPSTFPHHQYEKHPSVRMPVFKEDLFTDTTTKRGNVIKAKLIRNGPPNIIYDLIEKCNIKGRMFTMKKIRSRLRSELTVEKGQQAKTKEEIIEAFKEYMYAPKTRQTIDQWDTKLLSWIVPYVPPAVLFYEELGRENILVNTFREHILNLRGRVLQFVDDYITKSTLSRNEKEDMAKARIAKFVEIKRSPDIQKMYLIGHTKQQIDDHVHMNYSEELARADKNSQAMTNMRCRTRKSKSQTITRNRDEKYYDEFHCQSASYVAVCVPWCVIAAMFYLNWQRWVRDFGRNQMQRLIDAVRLKFVRVEATVLRIEQLERDIRDYQRYFTDFATGNMDQQTVITLMEFKSAFHCAHALYDRNYTGFISWFSNFAITRNGFWKHLIAALPQVRQVEPVQVRHEPQPVRFAYMGREYNLTPEDHQRIMELFRAQAFPELDAFLLAHEEPVLPQAGKAADIMTTVFGHVAKWYLPHLSDDDIKEANTKFTYINHFKKDCLDQVEMFKGVISGICVLLFAFDPFDVAYQVFAHDMLLVIQFTDEHILLGDDLITQRKIMQDILTMHVKACTLNTHPRMALIPSFLRNVFVKRLNDLEKLAAKSKSLLKGTHERTEPLMLMFTGPPGVGKSACMKYIQQAYCASKGTRYSEEMTYTFNSKDQFWEGYSSNHIFVIMDDVWKEKDLATRTLEAGAIIGMVNTAPFNLAMAFEGKGMNFFNSPVILASTNIANKGLTSTELELGMTDNGAIMRRLHIEIHDDVPLDGSVIHKKFTIKKCAALPQYNGARLTPPQIVRLMLEFEEKRDAQHAAYTLTHEQVLESLRIPEVPQEVHPEFGALNEVPLDHVNPRIDDVDDVAPPLEPMPHLAIDVTLDGVDLQALSDTEKTMLAAAREAIRISPESYISKFAKTVLCDLYDPERVEWLVKGFLLIAAGALAGTLALWLMEDKTHLDSKPWELETGKGPKVSLKATPYKLTRLKPTKLQSSTDNYHKSLINRVSKSVVQIRVRGYAPQRAIGFHVKGGYFAIPAHAVLHSLGGGDVYIDYKWNGKIFSTLVDDNVQLANDNDLMIFKAAPGSDLPPEAYRYLPQASEHSRIQSGTPLKLITYSHDVVHLKTVHKAANIDSISYTVADASDKKIPFSVEFPINYYEGTADGESGALLAVEDNQGRPVVVGMHSGRKGQYGFAIPFFKEYFDGIFDVITQSQDEFPMVIDYTVSDKDAMFPPCRSKIKRSPLHGWRGPPIKVPARLTNYLTTDGRIVDPLIEGLKKLQQVPKPITESPEDVFMYLHNMYPRIPNAGPTSLEEALNGDPFKGSTSITYGTSPGYPKCKSATKGKAPYIIHNGDRFDYSPDFEQEILQTLNDLREGKDVKFLFAVLTKDENRLIKTTTDGRLTTKAPRVFSTCPLTYLILMRMYCLDFVTYVQSLASSKGIAVGINPHSLDWMELYLRMTAPGGSIIAGDYSNFDGGIPEFVGEMALRFINEWYNDGVENQAMRSKLFRYIIRAVHICRDKVFTTRGSNPSGNPITSVYNSIVNIIMMYIVLTRDIQLLPSQFDLSTFGDDNIVGQPITTLSCDHLAKPMKDRFGMTYTHFSKDSEGVIDTIDTAGFLSRGFRLDSLVCRAPLALTTICESTYWIKGDVQVETVILSTAETFFLELSHHPREVFDELSEAYLISVRDRLPNLHTHIRKARLLYYEYHQKMYFPKQSTSDSWLQSAREGFGDLEGEVILQSSSTETTKNEQYTDRAMNDLVDTQETPLGVFQDAAPITSSAVDGSILQDIYRQTNVETFGLNGVLDREFLIDTFTWQSSTTAGTILGTYEFPIELFSRPFIAEKIRHFALMRAGIRVSVRIAANRNLYGALMMAYEPYIVNYSPGADLFQQSGNPHMIVSARSSEVIVMDLPFVHPHRAMDIVNSAAAEMGHVVLQVMVPLKDVMGEVSSAQVNVYAQFIDAEVFMPNDVITQSGKEPTITNTAFRPTTTHYQRIPTSRLTRGNKPTTDRNAQIIKINNNFDLNYGHGFDTTVKIANDPENQVGEAADIGGISEDEMDLHYVVGTPKLVKIVVFKRTDVLPFQIMECYVPPMPTNYAFVDYICQMFRFSSGSLKCKVYIQASMFHAVRGVVYLTNKSTADWVNCYHRIIDIQGDTDFEMTVPYSESVVAQTAIGSNWSLYYKTLSWSEPKPEVEAPIYLCVYKAGASDFKFGVPLETRFVPAGAQAQQGESEDVHLQSDPRVDFTHDFEPIHPSVTAYSHDSVLFGEDVTSLKELVSRYFPYEGNTILTNHNFSPASNNGFEQYRHLFRFWRGSVRHRYFYKADSNGKYQSAYVTTGNDQAVFGTTIKSGNLVQLDLEVPYYTNQIFNNANGTIPHALYVRTSNTAKFVMKGGGNDFRFHFLKSPPPGAFTPQVSSASANQALVNFFTV